MRLASFSPHAPGRSASTSNASCANSASKIVPPPLPSPLGHWPRQDHNSVTPFLRNWLRLVSQISSKLGDALVAVILDKSSALWCRRSGGWSIAAYGTFAAHFLTARRHRVERGSRNRCASQRDPGAQQSFARRAVHRCGLYACRCRWPDA
jgi:hypothetical protein